MVCGRLIDASIENKWVQFGDRIPKTAKCRRSVSQFGDGFPWGTLFVNVTGSFAIGFYAALTGPDGRLFVSPRQRQFVMVGICGGYTTFSSFSLETLRLVQSGNAHTAFVYLFVSVITWIAGVWLGHALAARLNRL